MSPLVKALLKDYWCHESEVQIDLHRNRVSKVPTLELTKSSSLGKVITSFKRNGDKNARDLENKKTARKNKMIPPPNFIHQVLRMP